MTYDAIANYLNKNNFKTPRGHMFRNTHAHSIIKKKALRDSRLNRDDIITMDNVNVIYM